MAAHFGPITAVLLYAFLLPSETIATTLESILEDWQRRRSAVETIHYVGKGTVTIPKGALNHEAEELPRETELPSDDYTYPTEFTWTIDFRNGRMRRKWHRQVMYMTTRQFIPDVTVEAFDGRVKRRWEPRSENTSETYRPSDAQVEVYDNIANVLRTEDMGILYAHGQFYLRKPDSSDSLFNWPIAKADLAITGESHHRGRRCVILRSLPKRGHPAACYDEFWVDPERGSAVVRWVQVFAGQMILSVEVDYDLVKGHWLPRRLDFNNYINTRRPGIPVYATNLQMQEIMLNRAYPVEEFRIGMEKGMVVEDAATGKQYRFREPKSGIAARVGFRRMLLILLTVALIGVAVVVAWRRRHVRKSSLSS